MKTLLLLLAISPLSVWAQTETVHSGSILPKPYGDTLKPIEFREYPFTYGNRRYVNTTLQRIYTYDGIDVEDPERELWPHMLALNDPDVQREHENFRRIVEGQRTGRTVGAVFLWSGIIAMSIGLVQANLYNQELTRQRNAWNPVSSPGSITLPPTTTSSINACNAWIGTGNSDGTITYTCMTSGPYQGYKTTIGPNEVPAVQITTPGKTIPAPGYLSSSPTEVNRPNGRSLIIGAISTLVGLIAYVSAPVGRSDSFLRAVQYYNRALKQKVSWELRPYSTFGQSGASIVVRF